MLLIVEHRFKHSFTMASFTLIIEAKLGSNNFTHKELHRRVLSKARKHWEPAEGHLQTPAFSKHGQSH